MLDTEFESVKQTDKYSRLRYHSDGKHKDFTTSDSNAFLKNGIQRDVESIDLDLHSTSKDICINLNVTWSRPTFEVTGRDATWVAGITKRLEEIFAKYRTNNQIFHTSAFVVPISIAIMASVAVVVVSFLRLYHEISDTAALVSIMTVTFSTFWGMMSFLGWLYPRVEMKHMTRVRIRKKLYGFIVAVILAVIANYIWLLITTSQTQVGGG